MPHDIASLSLTDGEEDELDAHSLTDNTVQDFTLCLVGEFLEQTTVHFDNMKNSFANLWRPLGGVLITSLSPTRFLFQFYCVADVNRIMEGTPWTHNRQFLLLDRIPPGSDPMSIPLWYSEFWVHVFYVSPGLVTEKAAKQFGAFIGQFLDYDTQISSSDNEDRAKYMRIRVHMDVRTPLKRRKKLITFKGEVVYAKFQYERLPAFCFLCGHLGHEDKLCSLLLHNAPSSLQLAWDVSLRADMRRRPVHQSSWLRNSDGSWGSASSPSFSAHPLGQSTPGHGSPYANHDLSGEDRALSRLDEGKKRARNNTANHTTTSTTSTDLSAGPGHQACREP